MLFWWLSIDQYHSCLLPKLCFILAYACLILTVIQFNHEQIYIYSIYIFFGFEFLSPNFKFPIGFLLWRCLIIFYGPEATASNIIIWIVTCGNLHGSWRKENIYKCMVKYNHTCKEPACNNKSSSIGNLARWAKELCTLY